MKNLKLKNPKNTLESQRKIERRAKRAYAVFACLALSMAGLILLGFGILQVGLSLQSHDPSQRSNGILTIAGGIVITFTKEILTLITGG